MRWCLRRYCGDVVEETADEKHLDADEAFEHSDVAQRAGVSLQSSSTLSRSGSPAATKQIVR
jgi:hypothetical protein